MSQKTLYILRHAKAESLTAGGDDHKRALAERGISEARNIGIYLVKQHIVPDKVLCSTATRTRQTWLYIQEHYPQTVPIQYEDKLYHTTSQAMLEIIASMPDSINKLMLVGHNPGLHELCMRLCGDSNAKLRSEMAVRFPTCSFVEVDVGNHWQQIASADTKLIRFITPDSL